MERRKPRSSTDIDIASSARRGSWRAVLRLRGRARTRRVLPASGLPLRLPPSQPRPASTGTLIGLRSRLLPATSSAEERHDLAPARRDSGQRQPAVSWAQRSPHRCRAPSHGCTPSLCTAALHGKNTNKEGGRERVEGERTHAAAAWAAVWVQVARHLSTKEGSVTGNELPEFFCQKDLWLLFLL